MITRFKYIFIVIIFFTIINIKNSYAQDSLKVHIIGVFHKEKYIIFTKDYIYTFETVKGHNYYAFYMLIPDSIKDEDLMDISIYKKPKLGFKYIDAKINCYYDNCHKYFILYRSFREKNKYSFTYYWRNKPPYYISLKKAAFYDNKIIPDEYSVKVFPISVFTEKCNNNIRIFVKEINF